jgi:squalene-associated FAD-dependent desaturase
VARTLTIVGGGLAGLAATVALAPRGYRITLLESRPRLGGRASSFTDPVTGQLVDACQHVSMGCCTNFAHFCRTIGVEHFLEKQPTLWFQTPDRRVSTFRADPWPAPFHLGRALAGAKYLTTTDKLRIAWGMAQLVRTSPEADPPAKEWLLKHWQNSRTIDRFWGVVLTSALNETVDRVGLKYARKVFVDGFLRHREGFTVYVPAVPLGRFYGEELRVWLKLHAVEVRESCGVKTIPVESPRTNVRGLSLRDGTTLAAERILLAVPFDRVSDLLASDDPFFTRIKKLAPSPITSVHLWYDRDITPRQHVVLVDCLGQWLFNRGNGYVQVVVSASRERIQEEVVAELARLFPHSAKLLRAKVVTEHTATFSAVPGVDAFRPPQATPIPNLFLAGDWTQTGWPATMEGAVRSGYLAAEAILKADGIDAKIVQPDLPRSFSHV